jgi:CMP/dCMP kinase
VQADILKKEKLNGAYKVAVIRVSGVPGAGKTTISKKLAEFLGYRYHYTGGVMREMARERGVDIETFYSELSNEPELEKEVDTRQQSIMRATDNIIVEGRMAPFLPCAPNLGINVLLIVDAETGAKRQLKRAENARRSFEEMLRVSKMRLYEEQKRYYNLYGIHDHLTPIKFDVIVDTSNLTPGEVLDETILKVRKIIYAKETIK